MLVVGLAGGSGSGKGAASRFFAEHGFAVVDTDAVYRELTSGSSQCLLELSRAFGEEIISPDGSLDREVLSRLVFSGEGSALRRACLNSIAHRHILDETRRRLSVFRSEGYPAAIVDAPLLFESGFDAECDITVCVVADLNIRISRIIRRDGITHEAAEQRIASQIPDGELSRMCTYTIVNNGDLAQLSLRVEALAKKIIER